MTKSLFSFLLLFSTICFAQTKHAVSVQNGSFSPSSLTITVGDTVEWTNVGGFHSVEGLQSVFPSNPESFGNTAGGTGWVYSFVFNTIGNYDYRCGIHTTSMFGSITVQSSTSINSIIKNEVVLFYPNPVKENLSFNHDLKVELVEIFDLEGKQVLSNQVYGNTINISHIESGIYFIQAKTDKEIVYEKLIVE